METISNSVWQRKGSSVIFDSVSLGRFISEGAVVSLREALGWMKGFPPTPPVTGRTILISGLEALLETMSPEESNEYLACRIRPLIIEFQSRWTDCGIIFGFSAHEKAFVETAKEEEVLLRRRDGTAVRLSEGLWDGSATVNMKRVVREDSEPGKEVVVGYYVARIS